MSPLAAKQVPSTPPLPGGLPALQVCEQARLSRDARFDGLFFTAVATTGIYCRPVCPAPPPKPGNITYYPNAAAAEAAGYRPCLRCRPELAPGDGAWRRGDAAVARAIKLINEGLLAEAPVAALAERVNLGERQLRRLFVERLGASPQGVHGTRRLLFAKQLLTETDLSITDIAMAAGFGSLRRFNTSFKDAYRMAPRELRKRPSAARGETLALRLGYRPPYDLPAMLDFLRGRALPGVEAATGTGYRRLIAATVPGGTPGWLRVSAWPGDEPALKLELHGVPPLQLQAVVGRIRRMFDLDADPGAIEAALGADPCLRPLLRRHPGLRLPSGWDGFEIAVRAIVGQQISVAAARTVTARLAERHGTALEVPLADGVKHLFPTPAALADADLDGIGLTGARCRTLRTVARALLDGEVDFRPEQTLDEFVERWTSLPGIGPWTAHYVAMRALAHPDAFPADDLVLQKMLPGNGARMTARALDAHAQAWRPWRAYAVMHLWRGASDNAATVSPATAPAPKKTPTTRTTATRRKPA